MTAQLYYYVLFSISVILLLVYVLRWHWNFDVHITVIFVLVPIANLGYAMMARANSMDAAIVANKIAYLGAIFLPPLILLAECSLCNIRINRWIRALFLGFSMVVYMQVLSIGITKDFYSRVSFQLINGFGVLRKEYGPWHSVFIYLTLFYVAMCLLIILYCLLRRNQVSRRILVLLVLPVVFTVGCFVLKRYILGGVETVPLAFLLALGNYLTIIKRLSLYSITDTAIQNIIDKGDVGFISFDRKMRYLGSNGTAKAVFPELSELTVDHKATSNKKISDTVLTWIYNFQEFEQQNHTYYEKDNRIYKVDISHLLDGKKKRGYQITLRDDTDTRQYIKLVDSFNSQLQSEVDEKTKHIVEMHDQLILGMATMVESRDNSTGGHIRRTSECMRILVNEMYQDPFRKLTDSFCTKLIKAAPMHDLGKIAVSDAVLQKPGRYTEEEFNEMKIHAAEGARIVHEILKNTDDTEFRTIAENVAHYHHERWDGSGYPEGLKGEEIPLEARIMAIVDVYDALVSKRVYKESFSFEEADKIIQEGMGTQFDPNLQRYYTAARPRLEAYYRSLDQQEKETA